MNERILETESLCPECFKKIPAYYEVENGKVYFKKTCKEHGTYRVLVWSNAEQYVKWMEQSVYAATDGSRKPVQKGCPYDCGLCEQHKCGICTAVLEITYQCNMECKVCFADTKKARYQPSLEKVREMYDTAYKNGGNCSIQLSGGEPTMREDLTDILKMGKEIGFSHIQINTNGIKIAQNLDYLQSLKDAGADLIYLQFDGTNDRIYNSIRGRDMWEIKQKAVENCEKVGIGIILVPVIMKNVNEDNIGDIVKFAKAHMPVVKGIHFQPVSYFGRYPGENPKDEDRINLSDVIYELQSQTEGEIKERHIVPRKPYDAHCSFSGLYYLGEEGRLHSLTKDTDDEKVDQNTNFAKNTNEFTNKHWRMSAETKFVKQGSMLSFLERLQKYMLTISAMGFQDIWNIDIERLKGCCVFVVSAENQVVPLCAFHVTSISGERLYKNE